LFRQDVEEKSNSSASAKSFIEYLQTDVKLYSFRLFFGLLAAVNLHAAFLHFCELAQVIFTKIQARVLSNISSLQILSPSAGGSTIGVFAETTNGRRLQKIHRVHLINHNKQFKKGF